MSSQTENKILFGKPKEVGYFSVDSRRALHYDRSLMRYYIPRSQLNLDLDLNQGYVSQQQKIHVSEKLEKILRWIAHEKFEVLNNGASSVLDFVTKRGTLQDIMSSAYYNYESDAWSVCATKLENTIYFCTVDTDYEIIQKANKTERQKLMSSWGFKFEQYMTAKEPNGIPDLKSTSFSDESFEIVVKSNCNNYSLLFEAEVDAVKNGELPGNLSSYLELKTSRNSPPYHSDRTFLRSKSLKWWAQAYVAGVKEIVCGFRSNDGIVTSVEIFNVDSLPKICNGHWDADKSVEFFYSFLNLLKKRVEEDNYRAVYKFDYSGGSAVSCTKIMDPEVRFQIVPEWFVEAMKNSHE